MDEVLQRVVTWANIDIWHEMGLGARPSEVAASRTPSSSIWEFLATAREVASRQLGTERTGDRVVDRREAQKQRVAL
eukprot:CAMPEP_0115713972 /NCGR_PEP_ID=MMETSP0272-20121206/74971_1 /TAXON_ID=71861 /ORGANISM="Scrippsiella trochoidea, Strain CCMP3099" /LENGTH=76 /DNA_ID=CAMNT_0003156047 /DNA_START=1 /DNA_END=234 /DNA_ORIENTATION=+